MVTDDDGALSAAVLTSVGGAQQAAQGRAEGERDDRESPFLVTFDASRSKDSDGTMRPTRSRSAMALGDHVDPVVTHTYVSAGKYTAGL